MNRSKIQITWILLLLGCFIFPNNSFAQSEKKEKKQVVIIKKTIDKDGNEIVEKIVKEGKEAEDFDVAKYLKEGEHEATNVNVEIRVTKEGDEKPADEEREIEVTVDGDNVFIMEGDEKTIIKKAKIYLKKYTLRYAVDLLFESEKVNKKKIYQICLDIQKNEKNN